MHDDLPGRKAIYPPGTKKKRDARWPDGKDGILEDQGEVEIVTTGVEKGGPQNGAEGVVTTAAEHGDGDNRQRLLIQSGNPRNELQDK